MSGETDSSIETVYVYLLNEGTEVMRPALAEKIGKDIFRILSTPEYDPEDEEWEFPPGSIVKCEYETRTGERLLVAKSSPSS